MFQTEKDIVAEGRSFSSSSFCERSGDLWTVTIRMKEGLKKPGSDSWIENELSAKCTDESMQKAYDIAMNSVLDQLNDLLQTNNGAGLLKESDYTSTENQSN